MSQVQTDAKEQHPQLMMCRPQLCNLPDVRLPEGFSIRSYQNGDAISWDRINCDAFGWDPTQAQFEKRMKTDAANRDERILFVCHHDEPVGTASAWPEAFYGPNTGTLHYVGVIHREAGKGLGYQISLAALHQMVREHWKRVTLRTDDIRVPAIKLYLKLCFVPFLVHEGQRQRWRNVFKRIQRPELIDEFKSQLEGPIQRT